MPKSTIDKINERGWGNGWHAQMLQGQAKAAGKTMAEQFHENIKDASGFNIHATAIASKGGKVTYRFLDGSTTIFGLPNFLRSTPRG